MSEREKLLETELLVLLDNIEGHREKTCPGKTVDDCLRTIYIAAENCIKRCGFERETSS